MKLWKPLVVALGALLVTTAAVSPVAMRLFRGVRLVPEAAPVEPAKFNPAQSAALFIGVPKFTNDPALEVRYAADDAVDLAYMFSLDPRVLLVPPDRVVLSLSGRPRKEASKRRLDELVRAGARIEPAGPSDILDLLQKQSAVAGPGGILIVSIATHGFTKDGVQYILGSSSLFRYPETALQMPRLLDIAGKSDAERSLFLVDTCRNRIPDVRGSLAGRAPMIGRMGRVHGQIVFSAATAGGYAYEGDGNGVFTKAVINGMSCKASLTRGAVTIGTLKPYVERYVRRWILANRNPSIRAATQVSIDGDSQNMPLSICHGPPPPPPPGNVARAVTDGSTVAAFSANGKRLWQHSVDGLVTRAEVADLDADGSQEVVVGANTITVFDRVGLRRWSAQQDTTLRQFLVQDLSRQDQGLEIVALWSDGSSASRVSLYAADGQRLLSYDHVGHLQSMVIDRPTSRHTRKIIVAGIDDKPGATFGTDRPHATVALLDSKLERVWAGVVVPRSARIRRLEVIDFDNDTKRDIVVSTTGGETFQLDFAGKVLNGRPELWLLGKRRR